MDVDSKKITIGGWLFVGYRIKGPRDIRRHDQGDDESRKVPLDVFDDERLV